MLKKIILLLCFVAPLAMMAQEKIAYLNSQEIMFRMPEIKTIETQLATKGEALKKSLDAIQTEYQTKSEEYVTKLEKFQKGDKDITESELVDAQGNLTQIQQRYETHAQATQAEYEKFQQELLAPVQQKVAKAIKDLGDEQKYTYILERSAILYVGDHAVDAGNLIKGKLGIVD